jgi:hypothetical protein
MPALRMSSDAGSKKKVPDAITQTDNSAKRQQNAQMRASSGEDSGEPEALRKMREEREMREAREQEQARLDAERRAKAKDFVSGQDVQEARYFIAHKIDIMHWCCRVSVTLMLSTMAGSWRRTKKRTAERKLR